MKKNKFKILNGLDNSKDKIEEITPSQEEKDSLKLKVRELIKEENKSKSINRKSRNKIIAASLSFVLIGSLVLNSESVIASMTSLGKKIESYFGKEEDSLKPYKEEVLKSVEDKGITFSLNELILNDEELVVSMMVDYGDFDFESVGIKGSKANKVSVCPNTFATITSSNGINFNISGMGASYDYEHENKITNMIMYFDMTGAELDKDYNLRISLEDMLLDQYILGEDKQIEGNWSLDVDFNGKKLKDELEIIKIDETIEFEKYGYMDWELKEVRKTPASIVVKLNNKESTDFINSEDKYRYVDFEFYDENGEKIDFISKGGNSEKELTYEYKGEKEFNKIKVVPVLYEERNSLFKLIGMHFKSRRLNEEEFYIDLK
ncbi:DUF4179 domain-containing protein [Clostridium perfringens]|nr:DUF4179 domain-containing protein [Clostridium perfringens]